jgi:hypothetical protein
LGCSPWRDGKATTSLEMVPEHGRSGDQAAKGCVVLPPGARQGPSDWFTIDVAFEVGLSDTPGVGESIIELRVNRWAGIQMTLARDGDGLYSVRGATTEGMAQPAFEKLPNGRRTFTTRNYLPVDAVSGGDSEVSLVYSDYGGGVTYLAARSVAIRLTPYPPSPVVVGVQGIGEGPPVARSFDVSVVVSTQRVDLAPEEVSVQINGEGATVRPSAPPVTSADGHARTFAFEVSARRSGELPLTVQVDVPRLEYSSSLDRSVEVAHSRPGSIGALQAVGLFAGLSLIVAGLRGTFRMRRRVPRST